jgi:hypothetical protein
MFRSLADADITRSFLFNSAVYCVSVWRVVVADAFNVSEMGQPNLPQSPLTPFSERFGRGTENGESQRFDHRHRKYPLRVSSASRNCTHLVASAKALDLLK